MFWYFCPHRERGGAASVASGGRGGVLGCAPWRHSTIMINSYLIERPMGASERSERRPPWGARQLERLFIHNSINGETSASRATRAGREGGAGPPRPGRGARQVFYFILRVLFVYMPPAGGAGGSELSDRARPERKRWGANGQARAGGGWGRWKIP